MNRRSFFKSCVLAIASVTVPMRLSYSVELADNDPEGYFVDYSRNKTNLVLHSRDFDTTWSRKTTMNVVDIDGKPRTV